MVKELITKYENNGSRLLIEELKQNTGKPRRGMDGQNWRIEMDCIWVNLKNVSPPFFKFMSVYIKISFTQRENHSQ